MATKPSPQTPTTPTIEEAMQARLEIAFNNQRITQAEAWMPEPRDFIVGTVEDLTMQTGGQYGDYLRVVYKLIASGNRNDTRQWKADSGYVALHVFHQLLIERLMELKTVKGSAQYIEYIEHRTKRNPTEDEIKQGKDKYHLYYAENWDTMTATNDGTESAAKTEPLPF